jgi:hypothetical protein
MKAKTGAACIDEGGGVSVAATRRRCSAIVLERGLAPDSGAILTRARGDPRRQDLRAVGQVDSLVLWVASVPHGVQASLMCSSPFATSIDRTRMGFSQAGQIHMGGGDEASNSRGWGMAPPQAGSGGLHHRRGAREGFIFARRRNLLARSGIRRERIITPPEALSHREAGPRPRHVAVC